MGLKITNPSQGWGRVVAWALDEWLKRAAASRAERIAGQVASLSGVRPVKGYFQLT